MKILIEIWVTDVKTLCLEENGDTIETYFKMLENENRLEEPKDVNLKRRKRIIQMKNVIP